MTEVPEIEVPLSRCALEVEMTPTSMDRDGCVTLEARVGALRIEATCDYEVIREADEQTFGRWRDVRVLVRLV